MLEKNKIRILVCGDIHGGLKPLLDVLEKSGYDKEYDKLIFLGDYVDGWSESSEVIDFLIDIEKQAIHKPIFIKGNHDEWCNQWLHTGQIHPYWLTNGGQATKDSYMNTGLLTEESHRKFFRSLHNYYIDDQNRGFVHGGYTSRKGIGHEPYQGNYYWDRDLWTIATILHGREQEGINVSSAVRFRKHNEIFIGHTTTTNWDCKPHYPEYKHPQQPTLNGKILIPMNRCNVWNLDTGGGWDGKISIMDIDTKEFWQSELCSTYYPNELGRYKKNIK